MVNTDLDLYRELERRGLTTSQRDYSSYYLGMSENYACLRGDRAPSERAMIHLFRRLWEDRHVFLALRVAHHLLFAAPTGDGR